MNNVKQLKMETKQQIAIVPAHTGEEEEEGRLDDAWINKRFSVWQAGYRESVAEKSRVKPEIEVAGSIAYLFECDDESDSSDITVLGSTAVNDVKTDGAGCQVKHEAMQIPGLCEEAERENETGENKPTVVVVAAETEAAQVMKMVGPEPTTVAELIPYGLTYCDVWIRTRVSQMISTQDCTELSCLQEEAKSFIQSLVQQLKDKFRDLDTGRTFSVFEDWAAEFVVNSLEVKRQEAIQVLKYVHKTFSNRYNKREIIQSQLTYEMVSKCSIVEEACSYLLGDVMIDDKSEATLMKAMGGEVFYQNLKTKRALTYLKCLERVRMFEVKLEGTLTDGVCFPLDPTLEGTVYFILENMEPLKLEEELEPEVMQVLYERVEDMIETVVCRLDKLHRKRIQSETEVVAKAVKYVKERHDKALEAKTAKWTQDDPLMLKKVHEEQVKIHLEAFKDVKGFVYSDLWNSEELEIELNELYNELDKQMVARIAKKAEELLLQIPFSFGGQGAASSEMDEKPLIILATERACSPDGLFDEKRQSRKPSKSTKEGNANGRQKRSSPKELPKAYSRKTGGFQRRRSTSAVRPKSSDSRRSSGKGRTGQSTSHSRSKKTEDDSRSSRPRSSSSHKPEKLRKRSSSKAKSTRTPDKKSSTSKRCNSPASTSKAKASPKKPKIVPGDDLKKLNLDTPSTELSEPPKDVPKIQFSDISDSEEDVSKAPTPVQTVQPHNLSYSGFGVAVMLTNDGVTYEGFGGKVESWNPNIRIKDPTSPGDPTLISVKDLLTSPEPTTKDPINFNGIKESCKFYNEEVLALHFRRIATNLKNEKVSKSSLQQTLVFAAPTTTSSNARLRLKNAAIIGGVSNPMFVQTTTAIAVGALRINPIPDSAQIITVYVQNGLIDVAICKVTGEKSVALKTGNCQKQFVINESCLPAIIKDTRILIDEVITSTRAMAPSESLNVKACFLVLNLPLVLVNKEQFFDPLVRSFHIGLKEHLTGVQVNPLHRRLIIDGALLISKESAEYNQSKLYSEVCPWTVYLDGGNGNRVGEKLLEANTQVDDSVVKRVKKGQLGDLLIVRRKFSGHQVTIQRIEECKKTFADPGAYIDIECSPQGFIEVKPCEMWEEILALQRSCMPMKPQFVRKAQENIDQLFPAFMTPQHDQRHQPAEKRPSLESLRGESPAKKIRL